MIVIHATWQRVALALIFLIPIILIIVAMIPTFLACTFSEKARVFSLKVCDKGLTLVKCVMPREEGNEGDGEGLKIALPGAESSQRV